MSYEKRTNSCSDPNYNKLIYYNNNNNIIIIVWIIDNVFTSDIDNSKKININDPQNMQ